MSNETARRIVIAGAGHAGGRAVGALRAAGYDGELILIGEETDPPYERPPLSKAVLKDGADPLCGRLYDSDYYNDQQVELIAGQRVTALDPGAKRLTLRDGACIVYDRLLLTTGSRVRTLEVPGSGLDGIFYLRSAADVRCLLDYLRPGMRVVVVGGGFIGLEVAASLSGRGCELTLLESAPHLLGRVVSEDIAAFVADYHRSRGVCVRAGVAVSRFRGDSAVAEVVLADGSAVPAEAVIVGIGVEPDAGLVERAGIACDNGILVDEYGRTSVPGVYAAGDVTNHWNPVLKRRMRLESWDNAERQSAAVARNMVGEPAAYGSVPWFWTDQFDLNLQVLGYGGTWTQTVRRGEVKSGRFSVLYLQEGRLSGAVLMNRGADRRPLKQMIETGAELDPRVLADTDIPLKTLLRRDRQHPQG